MKAQFISCYLLMMVVLVGMVCCKQKDTIPPESAIVIANKAYQDSLINELIVRDSIILSLKQADKTSEKKQSDISKSFKPVYEKINSADSIELLNQLTVLLAETDKIPLKRD